MSLQWIHVAGVLGALLSVLLAVWWARVHNLLYSLSQKTDFPQLTRLDPVKVGFVREMNLVSGHIHKIRTLSMRPALFEIENFLSEEECDNIIFMAKTQGLERSQTIMSVETNMNDTILKELLDKPKETFKNLDANQNGVIDTSELAVGMSLFADMVITDDIMEQLMEEFKLDADNNNVISLEEFMSMINMDNLQKMFNHTNAMKAEKPKLKVRVSNTAFLSPLDHIGNKKLFHSIRERIQRVTGLPKDIIWTSEDLQVLRYDEAGHYHCHYDSDEGEHIPANITCCHYLSQESEEKCFPCRFITFFYYLNEPEEGGETAFPIADNDSLAVELIRGEKHYLCDLSNYCHKAKIAYKPKRGTALFWYNHQLNENTGWVGALDKMSYHGGCDVIKGTKWAANNWINAGKNRESDKKSWAEYKQYVEDFDNPNDDIMQDGGLSKDDKVEGNEQMENEKLNEKSNEKQ